MPNDGAKPSSMAFAKPSNPDAEVAFNRRKASNRASYMVNEYPPSRPKPKDNLRSWLSASVWEAETHSRSALKSG